MLQGEITGMFVFHVMFVIYFIYDFIFAGQYLNYLTHQL